MQMDAETVGSPRATLESPSSRDPQQHIRLLLIEDNPGDARLIEMMVGEYGRGLFGFEHVERLSQALARIAKGGIDIVLSDLSVPDSHGLDTFTHLHAHAPQVPIIVLSGLNDTTVAVQAVHQGAQDYLIKGEVDGPMLIRAMRYAIERKNLTEQLHRYTRELRAKNAQLEADLNMAREIQTIFIPEQYPSFPAGAPPQQSRLRFSHRYLPAAAVGGDFFDVFPLGDTAAGVFICDVMGHGMRAALVTAIMRGLVEELVPIAEDPGRFTAGINRSLNAILRRTSDPFLATAFYGVIDLSAHQLRFANAGHPSPLLLRRAAGTVEPLTTCDPRHGPALGLFQQASFPTGLCPMSPGDLLLVFTDGIFEVRNEAGEEYGQARLLAALRSRPQVPTDPLLDQLLEDVQAFSHSREFEDDVCLLGAEVAPGA